MAKFQEVRIPLVASDQASPVFQKVGREADAMKRRIEAANKATALKADWLSSGSQAKQARRYSRPASSSASTAAKEVEDLSSSATDLSKVLASGRVMTGAWGAAIFLAGKEALEAAVRVDRLNKAYTTIEGSQHGAQMQLDYMYQKTRELGLQFYDTAEASKNFFAAMRGTAIEGEANKIWEAVTKAGAALSLSGDDMESIFRSLGQMVSKGKVMAEELRGQLGERLPGAFQLAAKAMGVTTMQLDKMLETGDVLADDLLPKLAVEIEKAFGPGAQQAAEGLQQNINRVSTEWERFKASILDSELVSKMLRGISDAMAQYNAFTQKVDRDRATDAEMRAARVVPLGMKKIQQSDFWGNDTSYFTSYYTEEQRKAWREARKELADYQKDLTQGTQKTDAALAKASAIISNYLKYTWESQRKEAEDEYKAVLKAIDDKIALYKKDGTDYAYLLEQKKQASAEYQRKLAELEKKHTKKADHTGPYTVDAAQKALDEIRKKQASQEAKAYRQETRDLDMVADVMQELAEKTGQYGLAVGAVNELIDRQGELWLKAGVPQNYVDQLKEIRRLEASNDGLDKMKLGWMEFYTESMDWGSQLSGAMTGMSDSIAGAFEDMASSGSASFKELASNAAKDLSRIAAKMVVVWTIQKALGWGVGELSMPNGTDAAAQANGFSSANPMMDMYAGMPAGVGHDGWGLVGSSRPSNGYRFVPPSLFADAPRFHGGTGFVKPGEYPAILKAGERVLNPAETRAYQRGGNVVNNINISTPAGYEAQEQRTPNAQGGEDVQISFIRKVVAGDMGTYGTQINRAMRTQGTRLPVMRGGG